MNEKYIGIIIQNQDEKILLYDDTYYIKITLCSRIVLKNNI